MKNKDQIQQERLAILQRMADATRENNAEAFSQAFDDFADLVQGGILDQVQDLRQQQDNAVLAARGLRVLTSAERKYYEQLAQIWRSPDPKQALANTNVVMPETIVDAVFDELTSEHPLLAEINFQNTGALTRILVSTSGGVAKWGDLGDEVTAELSANFSEIDLTAAQLTAFIPVGKYILELGPEWIDNYVRQLLTEALATQLEVGIVDGTGKQMPIGMDRKLTGSSDGVYPLKAAVSVDALDPATYGRLLATIATDRNGKARAVPYVILLCNPADYFTRVMPATTAKTIDGTYSRDIFPYPTHVLQSCAVPAGKAIVGLASRYFMGVGTQSGGKIEYDDSVRFLNRQRVYLTYLYGNGQALDENAFVLLDITGLQAYVPTVKTTDGAADARLASLAIGSLSLAPAFDRDVLEYTAATTNASNTITAIATDGDAEITLKNGSTAVSNGAAATWSAGANVVEISVKNGSAAKTYTVTVTKS